MKVRELVIRGVDSEGEEFETSYEMTTAELVEFAENLLLMAQGKSEVVEIDASDTDSIALEDYDLDEE